MARQEKVKESEEYKRYKATGKGQAYFSKKAKGQVTVIGTYMTNEELQEQCRGKKMKKDRGLRLDTERSRKIKERLRRKLTKRKQKKIHPSFGCLFKN